VTLGVHCPRRVFDQLEGLVGARITTRSISNYRRAASALKVSGLSKLGPPDGRLILLKVIEYLLKCGGLLLDSCSKELKFAGETPQPWFIPKILPV